MNENLSQMVKDSSVNPVMFSETDLDLPQEVPSIVEPEQPQNTLVVEGGLSNKISLTCLSAWFEANVQRLENVNQVKVSIRGVSTDKTLIMTVKDGNEKDTDGNDKRNLKVFDNADLMPVLDLPGVSMDIYNNGFRIIHQLGDTLFIKTYGIKTGLICVMCNKINEKLIPYNITRIKKKSDEFEIISSQVIENIQRKLTQASDMESLQLMYKQITKSSIELPTNQAVVDWLLDKQNSITDINHHLQIDNVIITILS